MNPRKSDLLSAHARAEIDHWVARYPVDRKQSAVLAALQACWSEPLDAMAELENLLFRKRSGELFDLPITLEVVPETRIEFETVEGGAR